MKNLGSGPLAFFGVGCGGSRSHTNAYFTRIQNGKRNLYFIDMSLLNVYNAMDLFASQMDTIGDIFIAVTHMHPDHASGVGALSAFFATMFNKRLNIVVHPNLAQDLKDFFRITGEIESFYRLFTLDEHHHLICPDDFDSDEEKERICTEIMSVFKDVIPTWHDQLLEGKCFGFRCQAAAESFVYTGDTGVWADFVPYIQPGDVLYVEARVETGKRHLSWYDIYPEMVKLSKDHAIWFMHYTQEERLRNLVQNFDNIALAEPLQL